MPKPTYQMFRDDLDIMGLPAKVRAAVQTLIDHAEKVKAPLSEDRTTVYLVLSDNADDGVCLSLALQSY